MAASTAVTPESVPEGVGPTEKATQIASLTGLRGVSALMVVLIHVSGRSDYVWFGVPSYGPVSLFVLSGFLLYRPWARWSLRTGSRPRVRQFAWRRVCRIFPAYLLVLVVVSLLDASARPEGVGGWVRAATLTWFYEVEPVRGPLLHTWSLCTEISWYVALPLMAGASAAVARRLPRRRAAWFSTAAICLAFPVSALWRWWVEDSGRGDTLTYVLWLPSYLFCFAAGALVAHVSEARGAGLRMPDRVQRLLADRWALPVLAVAVALLGTSALGGPPGFQSRTFEQSQVRVACAAGVAVLLLMVAVWGDARSPARRTLGSTWLNAVGRWSYGIYLWHLPVVVFLERDTVFPPGPLGLVMRVVLVLGITVPLSAATYAWVERPALEWSRQRRRDDAAATPTSAQASNPSPTPSRSEPPAG